MTWIPLLGALTTFPRSLVKMVLIENKLRSMVDHAKAWAESQGASRKNPVHGKQEYRVPTDFKFLNRGVDRSTTKASSSVEVEAGLVLECWKLGFSPHKRMQHSGLNATGCKGPSCGRRCWSQPWKDNVDTRMRFKVVMNNVGMWW